MSSEDSDILLSVVVPTKGRPECVSSLLRGLNASSANRFEVIVHDNSDDRQLGALISELDDARIRYIYTDLPLNMHENFDLAIGYARGEYICTIGDDDSILVADALDVLDRAKRQDIDAVVTKHYSYQWPGIRHPLWGDMGGMLSGHPEAENAKDMVVSPQAELEWVLRSGGVVGMHRLPRIYHGFVSRKSMDALFKKCGTYFPGASPDMANAVALTGFVNAILYCPLPILISGHSPKSGGGKGSAGTHHGALENQTQLPKNTVADWNAAIPKFWSGVTVYAQSVYTAAKIADPGKEPALNYSKIYAASFVFERRYWRELLVAIRTNNENGVWLWAKIAVNICRMIMVRALSFAKNIFFKMKMQKNPKKYDNIEQVMATIAQTRPGAENVAETGGVRGIDSSVGAPPC